MSTAFQLGREDLARLPDFFPSLTFERDEQIQALLHSGTRDFQAAPGSGKTTLLGAKLSLMAARWPHERRGICILTHTNVAREEIENCLRSVPHGESLLAYPHFIGTIQTFVNRFIALPWLRAQGIELREIDEEDFEARFSRRALADYSIKMWVAQSQYQRDSSIRRVCYRGDSLNLVTNAQMPLPAKGTVIDKLRAIKSEMMLDGRVRHEDMFAFAEQALEHVPELKDSVEYRFPNVFIDEMQDTSDAQLEVLTKVFRQNSIIQRFGDINQSILCRGPRLSAAAFPTPGSLEVRTSLRFGSFIAGVANSVKAVGEPIVGAGPASAVPPTLLLYSAATVCEVVSRFGAWVAPFVTQAELDRYPVKAVCAIKRDGNAKQVIGRHIRDYFPGYDERVERTASLPRSVSELLRTSSTPGAATHEKRLYAARAAVLLMLGKFGRDEYAGVITWRDCARLFRADPHQRARVQAVVLDIVLGLYLASTREEATAAVTGILQALGDLVVGAATSFALPDAWFEESLAVQAWPPTANCLRVRSEGLDFPVHLATIAAVKGETHLATLVLESCHDRKYDLKSLLPYLIDEADASLVSDEATRNQLMNIFVAASRPRKVLAFAMHADRANVASREKLKNRGWNIVDWTSL